MSGIWIPEHLREKKEEIAVKPSAPERNLEHEEATAKFVGENPALFETEEGIAAFLTNERVYAVFLSFFAENAKAMMNAVVGEDRRRLLAELTNRMNHLNQIMAAPAEALTPELVQLKRLDQGTMVFFHSFFKELANQLEYPQFELKMEKNPQVVKKEEETMRILF